MLFCDLAIFNWCSSRVIAKISETKTSGKPIMVTTAATFSTVRMRFSSASFIAGCPSMPGTHCASNIIRRHPVAGLTAARHYNYRHNYRPRGDVTPEDRRLDGEHRAAFWLREHCRG